MKSLYSFLDSKTGVLTPPTVMQSDAEAVRSLYQLFMNGNQQIPLIQFAEDFTFFRVADWDDEKGIIPIKAWENLGNVGVLLSSFRLKVKQAVEVAGTDSNNSAEKSDNDSSAV